ncbi:GYDIA family GHMP kinase [Sungkyunkwania multivorans]|uniref:GYDIA family GHMP kinase n=1 Tax=Sungkyunkwania multivorans TaxID=1173618 RepID=A0ABW3D285_9FLAO
MKKFYSNGKLLLTGEYVVLDGAKALAIPTKYGQSLSIAETDTNHIKWQSLDHKGNVWFKSDLLLNTDRFLATSQKDETTQTLVKLLSEANKLNPSFLAGTKGLKVTSKLDFPRNWGLGSSSTLINNIAQWAGVDAYQLLWNAFSGSGYDIACAQHDHPIIYQLKDKMPHVEKTLFDPTFKDRLYFVHLNEKQNSREGIAHYRKAKALLAPFIQQIDEVTEQFIKSRSLNDLKMAIELHERLIADLVKLPTVKERLFPDYFGSIKSLGAWGGDFVLATGDETTTNYFKEKGFHTVIPYKDMVL